MDIAILERISDLEQHVTKLQRVVDALRMALKYCVESTSSPDEVGRFLASEMEKAVDA